MTKHFAYSALLLGLSMMPSSQAQINSQLDPQTNSRQVSTTANAQEPVYLPSGLEIQVRVNDKISSDTAQAGDTFSGSLVNSIDDDHGRILFERGATVTGRVISAKPSGRLQDSGELVLSINSIRSESSVANVTVMTDQITGRSHSGSNSAKIGGGAILGAIIGGIAGGGKGAAIGAGAGAAAGTGAAAATGKKEARVDPESILRFVTSTETTVAPAGSQAAQEMERYPNAGSSDNAGPRDDNAPILRRRPNTSPNADSPDADKSNTAQSTNTSKNSSATPQVTTNTNPTPRTSIGSDTTTNTASNTTTNTSNAPTTSTSTSAPTVWSFSQRDRRVIGTCLADTPGSVPSAGANTIPYRKGDTVPYSAQRQLRSLPLACEKQLPAVSNELERVIYNQQVLLINSNNLVLDAFDVISR